MIFNAYEVDSIEIKSFVRPSVNTCLDIIVFDICTERKNMNFDNVSMGMLLFYIAGALIMILFALIYLVSKK